MHCAQHTRAWAGGQGTAAGAKPGPGAPCHYLKCAGYSYEMALAIASDEINAEKEATAAQVDTATPLLYTYIRTRT